MERRQRRQTRPSDVRAGTTENDGQKDLLYNIQFIYIQRMRAWKHSFPGKLGEGLITMMCASKAVSIQKINKTQ
jgi:hypothetical protein